MADQIDVGPPPVQLAGGRSRKGIVLAVVVVVIGAVAAFAWLDYGDRLSELGLFGAGSGSTAVAAGDGVPAADFAAFQAQTSASLQSATQLLTEQQAELKRLAEQLTALNARIDGLQGSLATTPPAATSAAPVAPTTAPVAAASRPLPPRKRAPAPPAGAISVGGAPLPGTAPRR